jgi:surface protein
MEYEGDDCECSMTSSSLGTAFFSAEKFNSDLSSWDVSLVENMDYSKLCAFFVCLIR